MSEFVLKSHIVGEASFVEHSEREKKNVIEVGVDGSVLTPKDEGKKAIIKLNFHFGKEDERLYLVLKTVTVFEVTRDNGLQVTEEEVQERCLPVALAQLRKTVKSVMEAYGRPGIDLPPFEEENIEE